MSATHEKLSNFIWEIADLLRGPYRPPQYERVMLPMTVLRRFDCVLEPTKKQVLAKKEELEDKGTEEKVIDRKLKNVTGHDFYNTSELTFEKLKSAPRRPGGRRVPAGVTGGRRPGSRRRSGTPRG